MTKEKVTPKTNFEPMMSLVPDEDIPTTSPLQDPEPFVVVRKEKIRTFNENINITMPNKNTTLDKNKQPNANITPNENISSDENITPNENNHPLDQPKSIEPTSSPTNTKISPVGVLFLLALYGFISSLYYTNW